MSSSEYRVTGMTCENCERHVREEVLQLPGVIRVDVDHHSGRLRVITADSDADDAAVFAAVAEAGYAATRG